MTSENAESIDDGIIIVEPSEADIEPIADLFKEDMDDLGVDTERGDLAEVARRCVSSRDDTDAGALCWAARNETTSEVVGVVLANFNWSLKFAGRSLWIETLYVTPSARRRGIGRMLVEHLLNWAEDHDIRGIDLEAYRGNTPASILYRSLGFRRLGRERFYYRIDGGDYL